MNWTAPKIWEGDTAVILAGGPSLWGFDAEMLCGRARVLTINDSWRLCRDADLHYYCDQPWMDSQMSQEWFADTNENGIDLDSGKWVKGGEEAGVDPRVKLLRFTGQLGFDPDPGCLRHGSNSGYQAIHLAAHLGAARIILLGYDMRTKGSQTHWHNEPRGANFHETLARDFLPLFQFLVEPLRARGIEVINSTPDSALKLWPFLPLESALCKEYTAKVLT